MSKKAVDFNAKQEQIHDIVFSREIAWQEIIYDLINTEQIDPWDINIIVLTDKYLDKIRELEEADFFVSSKVLLAAALLLRLKSEILLNRYIKSIDEILFGKKEQTKPLGLQRIDFDEIVPELVPRSPIPRFKKVTLKELIESLNKAIVTENRRIKKEIVKNKAFIESSVSMPKKGISIGDKIKEIYERVFQMLKSESNKKVSFTDFAGASKEERLVTFGPLLHLEHQKKVWLDQKGHFEEFHIWLKDSYLKHNPDPFAELKKELAENIGKEDVEEPEVLVEEEISEEEQKRLRKIAREFQNPIGEDLE